MKVVTFLGTRPEIVRLSRVIEKLDRVCNHVLVHTGQNFDPSLSDLVFNELEVRAPDRRLGIGGNTVGQQIGLLLGGAEEILRQEVPDAVLILGDTNSGLASIVAKRLGIPVYHMEAGNRCYDDRVPEEINRRIIDHCSDILMPYTHRSKENLLREGIPRDRIYVTGNPILEVLNHYGSRIDRASALERLGLEARRYFLVTMHRAENVDIGSRLRTLAAALDLLYEKHHLPVVCRIHPRSADKMRRYSVTSASEGVRCLAPLGFFDFVALERSALCVLSDSGTVQEECCLLRVPAVTIRDVTERPETIECGSNILSGCEPHRIVKCVDVVLANPPVWQPPAEYLEVDVSTRVVKILLGYRLKPVEATELKDAERTTR